MPATFTDSDLGIGAVLSDAAVGLGESPIPDFPAFESPVSIGDQGPVWTGAQLPPNWKSIPDASQMLTDPTTGLKRESGMETGTGLTAAVASDPIGFAKSIPSIVGGAMMAPGKLAYAGAADVVAGATGDTEYGGNLASMQRGEDQLPAEKFIGSTAPAAPNLAVGANIAKGIVEMAPMMGMAVLPSTINRIAAGAFSLQMIAGVKSTATELGTELGKPADQQDSGKIASLKSDLIQTGIFAPLAGAGAASGLIKPRGDFQGPLATGEVLRGPKGAIPSPETQALEAVRSQAGESDILPPTGELSAADMATAQDAFRTLATRRGQTPTTPPAPKAVPTSPEGMVRLYSGSGGPEGAGQGGSFFSTDPKRAATYGPNVVSVDVPKLVADAARTEALKSGSGTSGDHILPDKWVRNAKPFKAEQIVHEIPNDPATIAKDVGITLRGTMKGKDQYVDKNGVTVTVPAGSTHEVVDQKLYDRRREYAQAVADEIGFELSPERQIGSMKLSGLPPEIVDKLKASGQPLSWDFTDRRKGSPSEGRTFYVPEDASPDQIRGAHQKQMAEFGVATPVAAAPPAEPPPAPKPADAEPPRSPGYERKLAERRAAYAKAAQGGSTENLIETLKKIGEVPAWPTDGINLMRRQAIEAELARRQAAPPAPPAAPVETKPTTAEGTAKGKRAYSGAAYQADANEFRRLVEQHGMNPEHGWIKNPDFVGQKEGTWKDISHNTELQSAYKRVLTQLGIKTDRITEKVKAQALPALKAYLEAHAKLEPVPLTAMPDGSEFTIMGEPHTVDSTNPDTGIVTIKDGRTLKVDENHTLKIDPGSLKAAPHGDFTEPKSDLTLGQPESVDQQNARLEAEKTAALKKGQGESLQTGAAKPLVGSVGTIGQRDMFGGGDLFSQEPKPAAPYPPENVDRIITPDQEYDAALEKSRAAARAFTKIQKAYRARTIGDNDFLDGRKEFDKAMSEFDAAESKFIDSKNQLAKPAAPEKGMPPGPGAQTAGTDTPEGSQLVQLSRTVRLQSISPKEPFDNRLRAALDIAGKWGRGKDAATATIGKLVATKDALWDRYTHLPVWDNFTASIGRWIGADQRTAIEVRDFQKAITKTVPNKLRREAITNWIQAEGDEGVLRSRVDASKPSVRPGYQTALNLNEAEKTLARNISSYFESRLQEGIDQGILKQGVDAYVNQIWKRPTAATQKLWADLFGGGTLNPNFKFAKKRIFESYFEGEQAGFIPKNKDIGNLISTYDMAFNRALSARGMIRELHHGKSGDGMPIVMTSGQGVPLPKGETPPEAILVKPNYAPKGAVTADGRPYRPIDHWALRDWKWVSKTGDTSVFVQGDMLVHPDQWNHLNNILKTSRLRQNPVTNFLLNAGSFAKQTKLSLSPFHTVQEGAHSMAHRVNPVNPSALDLADPIQKSLIDHGLMVADPRGFDIFTEGTAGGGLVGKIPGLGALQQWYTEMTFKDYIPRLKMAMAKDALERNQAGYAKQIASRKVTDDQIIALTARESNAAFGEQNYRMMGRSPTTQDFLRLALLAPDFLEARARFVGQALKPYGREQRIALALMGATLYTGARILNKTLDDDYHWDKPFSVFQGGREYRLRTILGDVQHLVTDPRSFWYNRLSPITRTASEYVTGRNDQGIKRSSIEQFADLLSWFKPIPAQRRPGDTLTTSVLGASGVPSKPYGKQQELYEILDQWRSKQTDPKIKEQYDRQRVETHVQSPYGQMRTALAAGDIKSAQAEYSKLKTAHTHANIRKSLSAERPFTGSKATESKFIAALSPEQKIVYRKARLEREQMLRRFDAMAKP